jgi:diadenylate cyclase
VVERDSHVLIEALGLVAPGTSLRDGLDRVLQEKRGALVVVGDDAGVLSICTGGFLLDAEFTPQRLSELAKMDGAVILARDASRIALANVHLVPRASIPTSETGTRHRTAERVARLLDVPVLAVSGSMSTITVYRDDWKHIVQPTARLVDRAAQALSTLQRFKMRFDQAMATLSTLEVEDSVSVRDVVAVVQPGEMLVRIAEEIEDYLVELGEDGRLIHLQLRELTGGAGAALRLVLDDYVAFDAAGKSLHDGKQVRATRSDVAGEVAEALHRRSVDELVDPIIVADTLGMGGTPGGLDMSVEPRGYRLLHRLPKISDAIIDRIVERFTDLPGILAASLHDLEEVGGVGGAKARAVKDGLARIVEASILERFD